MNKIKLLLFLMLTGIGIGVQAQAPEIVDNKLTLYEGYEPSASIPFGGADKFFRSQHIIPAADLANLNGQTVYGLSYCTFAHSDIKYTSTVEVYLKEVTYTEFAEPLAFEEHAAADVFYTGTVECIVLPTSGNAEMIIVFEKPFTYNGGNLLIGFDNITPGSSIGDEASCVFRGIEATYNAGLYASSSTSMEDVTPTTEAPSFYTRQFLPQITFFMSEKEVKDLKEASEHLTITDLVASEITANSAKISWTGTAETYDLYYYVTADEGISMGFESHEDFSKWTTIDADGDGNDWFTFEDASYAYNGTGSIMSQSWASGAALTPDNWLVSPQVELGGDIGFWIKGTSYPDRFGVAVSTTSNTAPSAFTMIGGPYEVTADWEYYSFDLSAYSGKGYVAIRHYDCTDQNFIIVDDIAIRCPFDWTALTGLTATTQTLTGLEPLTGYTAWVRSHYAGMDGATVRIQFTTKPSDGDQAAIDAVIDLIGKIGTVTLASETAIEAARTAYDALKDELQPLVTNYDLLPAAEETLATLKADALRIFDLVANDVTTTSATINWKGTGSTYDLRYQEYSGTDLCKFEEGLAPWTTIDADGDGHNWMWKSGYATHSGSGCVVSASYDNTNKVALNPDNWLVSPQVELGGNITLWATAQDQTYFAEHFAVYVSTTGNTNPDDFVLVSEEYEIQSGRNYQLYTVDLSAYSGMGYVAIRHFNCSDMFYLLIDDIEISGPVKPTTDVIDLTATNYALSGLTAGTGYKVEVRSHYGSKIGEWARLLFSTAANDEDAAAAKAVVDLIHAIGTPVTFASETAIEAARTAYDALTDAQKALIGSVDYAILTNDEDTLAELKDAAAWDGWVYYDDHHYTASYGLSSSAFKWGIVIPSGTLTHNTLTQVALYEANDDYKEDITLSVCIGGDEPDYAYQVYSETFTPEKANKYHVITLASPVTIDPTQNVWIIFESKNSWPMSATNTSYKEGMCWGYIYYWSDISYMTDQNGAWKIRAFFADPVDPEVQNVIDLIAAIAVPVTVDSEPDITAARDAYNNLTDEQKGKVTNLSDLEDREAELAIAIADAIVEAKETLLWYVNELYTLAYYVENTLKEETYAGLLYGAAGQAMDVYTNPDAKLADINNAITTAAANRLTAMNTILSEAKLRMSTALNNELQPSDNAACHAIISAAISQVNAVTFDANDPAATTVNAIENELSSIYYEALLKLAAARTSADDVQSVIDLINVIATPITLDSETDIIIARDAFNSLSEEQKAQVTNINDLVKYEAELEAAKAAAEAQELAEAKAALQAAINDLNALYNAAFLYSAPEIYTPLGDALEAAVDAYENLTTKVEVWGATADAEWAAYNAYNQVVYDIKEAFRGQLLDLKTGDVYYEAIQLINDAIADLDMLEPDYAQPTAINIPALIAACQKIYDDTQAAIADMVASDTRAVISSCEFTGFEGFLKAGQTWNYALLNALVNALVNADPTAPYYILADECMIATWDEVNDYVGDVLDPAESPVLQAGQKYLFALSIVLDGTAGTQYRFPKTSEGTFSLTVDGELWEVAYTEVNLTDSYLYAISPLFTLSETGTGCETIADGQSSVRKLMIGGHLYILRDGKMYNALGAEVK